MQEPVNGADVTPDMAGMTIEEMFALTIGNLVEELQMKSVTEDILILEGSTYAIRNAAPLKVTVMVTIDQRGDKYVNAVKARMLKEAKRRHDAEVERARKAANS